MIRLKYICVVLLLLLGPWAGAQQAGKGNRPLRRENVRLAATSTDPEVDSLMFSRMREKMDKIRREQGRPTVALVLSGGGAKGVAHVSIIKYLEEQKIPVDMVLGTSMGGLIGGLYALGYTADELDSLVRGMDWDKALSDKVSQDFVSYNVKMRQQRYLISMPFHYAKEDFVAKVGEGVIASARRQGVHLSAAQEEDLVNGAAASTSFNSLPAGFAYGVNVNNIIASKTVGYQDSLDFSTLPIPFFCVSTDIVSCKAKYWTSGPLNTAMRSTMSIPVLFEPVRYKDMILIDGGTRNNYPTDMARAMGADIIIGVVLADADLSYAQINNIMDLVMQVSDMLGREAYVGNMRRSDVSLRPDMTGFGMMSFSKEAVDSIMKRGYDAALANAEALARVKEKVGDHEKTLQAPRAVDITKEGVIISQIRFNGVDEEDARYLRREIRIKEGNEVMAPQIDEAVCRLFSMDAFESVNYTLSKDGDEYVLIFNCNKGPVHRIGGAGRGDTEELVAAMLNVGLNVNKLRGSRLDFEGRVGNRSYALLKYSFTAPLFPTFNLEGKWGSTNAKILKDQFNYQSGFRTFALDGYFSGMRLENFDFRAGAKYERYRVDSWLTDSGNSVPLSQMQLKGQGFGSIYFNLRHYTLDDLYFPSKGLDVGVDFQYLPWSGRTKMLGMDIRTVFPMNPWLSLLPEFYFRSLIDASKENLFHANYVGGAFRGRYLENQMPFAGFNHMVPAKDFAMVLNLNLRARLAKNFYTSLIGSCFVDDDVLPTSFAQLAPTYLGAALELAYDSLVGPVRVRLQWSDFRGWSGYVGIGFDF